MTQNNSRVVISGVAPICSLGTDKEGVWCNIINGVSTVQTVVDGFSEGFSHEYKSFLIDGLKFTSKYVSEDSLKEVVEWKKGGMSLDFKVFLNAISGVIDDSSLELGTSQLGLFICHENPELEFFFNELVSNSYKYFESNSKSKFEDYFTAIYDKTERHAYETQSFMLLYHLTKLFKIHGYSLTINNACSSGLYAIEAASQAIRDQKIDMAIVAAADCPTFLKQLWLEKMGLYSADGLIRPFDVSRSGFVLGQGGCAIVLESLESAQKRDTKIYCEYLGGGFRLESWKVSLPAVHENFFKLAIDDAIKQADLCAEDISVINAHGIGTQVGDRYEANAISEYFKDSNPYVTALKPKLGHTLGASSLLELAIFIMSLDKGEFVPIEAIHEIDKKLKINLLENNLCIDGENAVLKLSHSFGGYLGAAIFKKFKEYS